MTVNSTKMSVTFNLGDLCETLYLEVACWSPSFLWGS